MSRVARIALPLAAAVGVLVTASLVAVAKPAGVKTVSCTLKSVGLPPAGSGTVPPLSLKGHQFGLINCAKPLGQGVQYNNFSVKLEPGARATATGSVIQYYSAGTLRGRVVLHSKINSATNIVDHGTTTIVGGTGAYKGATGIAQVTCVTTDGAIHHTCAIKLRLHVPGAAG